MSNYHSIHLLRHVLECLTIVSDRLRLKLIDLANNKQIRIGLGSGKDLANSKRID